MYRPALLATAIFFAGTAPALAETTLTEPALSADELDFDLPIDAAMLSDKELGEQRGGFTFQGMEIKLGADIRTFLNGELALHTVISMDGNGLQQTQTVSGGLTLADADALRNNVLSNGAITMNVGDNQVYLANGGQTAIYHATDGSLQNVLVNTASNISASQEVTATLEVGGYQMFADTLAADRLSGAIGEDITRAMTGSFGL
jgi:hypothetical protein